jgi:hypothetical protein
MPGGQADLVPGAVQPEADGASGLTAVTVIDQHSRYLHSHGFLCRAPAWRWRAGLASSPPHRLPQHRKAESVASDV